MEPELTATALYVHLPWCERKCPYCDFNSYEAGDSVPEQAYVNALLADLARECDLAGGDLRVTSVFIGGGTPSLFSAESIGRLLGAVTAINGNTMPPEVTLEANPGSAEAGRFGAYRAAGVNRLSLGIQSFDDARLRALGRVHDSRQAHAAIDAARRAGFDNLNLDLMFGLPGSAPGDAEVDLAAALAHAPQHLSWYQLTLEPGTAFAHRPPPLPHDDTIADAFDRGAALLEAAGMHRYEVSAWAQPGRECAHNLNYWRFGSYIGIGAGAHGLSRRADGVFRRDKIRHPQRYRLASLAGSALHTENRVSDADLVFEFMLNALRLRDGFALGLFEDMTGLSRESPGFTLPLAAAVERGWLEREGDMVRPSAHGYRFLNDLQMLFLPGEGE